MMNLYDEVTGAFQKEMVTQLENNKRKGDRRGWLSCTPMQLLLEVYYHTGKLQNAVKENNLDEIREYAADVANMAMMVLDASGGLLPNHEIEDKVEMPNTQWIKEVTDEKV